MINRAINTEFSRHFHGMIAQEALILASRLVANSQEFDKFFTRLHLDMTSLEDFSDSSLQNDWPNSS